MSKRISGHIDMLQDMLRRAGIPPTRASEYERELRESIERGVADSEASRVVSVEDLMKELGIDNEGSRRT